MNTKNSIYKAGTIVTILVFATGTFVSCGDKKKEEPTTDRKEEDESSNVKDIKEKNTDEKIPRADRDRESPPARETAETARSSEQPAGEPPADEPPADEPPADEPPPENPAKSSVSEARTPFPEGKEVPHSECNTYYKSGTAHFRAKEWDKAVDAFVKYPQGRCLGLTQE